MDAALATTNTMTGETTVPVENIKTTTTEETTPTTAETSTAATTELTSEEKATQSEEQLDIWKASFVEKRIQQGCRL
ncbi:unnamed protein product [Caenorhabditis angaria]|uniref:Uncharacterized protein n=1 Tax=Caenorhabditis angaria TaxID=860376 RepID=A0A9P1I6L4_9PELO|nr:unnamed protein product [Caenorhabditis angaria]